jgi:hypothetical protein
MVTRLSAADAVSLHTQTSTTPAQTVTFIIIEASDQLSHVRLTGWSPRRSQDWRASAAGWWANHWG